MEVSIKFSPDELRLLWEGLSLGSIHTKEDKKSHDMQDLMIKIEAIGRLVSEKK